MLSIILPISFFYVSKKNRSSFKKILALNITCFFSIILFSTFLIFTQKTSATELVNNIDPFAQGMGYLAAALVTGMSTVGAGIATGSAAAAALGAISENESIMGKALIFVALAEGIAIYGLLISFTILGRI